MGPETIRSRLTICVMVRCDGPGEDGRHPRGSLNDSEFWNC